MIKKTALFAAVLLGSLIAAAVGIWVYSCEIGNNNLKRPNDEAVLVQSDISDNVGENAVLTFKIRFEDGFSDTREIIAPYYMKGWSREKLAAAYPSWQLNSFSSENAVFSKSSSGRSSQHYLIGEKDGYVAVYYKDSGLLKEVTAAPIASLSEDERRLILQGKSIDGDESLYLCLQDLES